MYERVVSENARMLSESKNAPKNAEFILKEFQLKTSGGNAFYTFCP